MQTTPNSAGAILLVKLLTVAQKSQDCWNGCMHVTVEVANVMPVCWKD